MEFGKLQGVDRVDFTLPASAPPRGPAEPVATPEVLLGAARFSHRGFVGCLYPHGTKADEYLPAYARQFTTIELNSTFYGWDAASIARWAAATPPDFRFCIKLPKSITHDARLGTAQVTAELDALLAALEALGPRLATLWALLPEDFGPRELPALEAFAALLADRAPLAVELRHPALFQAPARDAAFGLLEDLGIGAVLTDVAGRRDVLHMERTTHELLLRFVGNRLHPSDRQRLDAWVERLAEWFADGSLHRVHFLLHQPEDELVVPLAHHLAPRLGERLGVVVRAPEPVPEPPRQGALF